MFIDSVRMKYIDRHIKNVNEKYAFRREVVHLGILPHSKNVLTACSVYTTKRKYRLHFAGLSIVWLCPNENYTLVMTAPLP